MGISELFQYFSDLSYELQVFIIGVLIILIFSIIKKTIKILIYFVIGFVIYLILSKNNLLDFLN